MKRIQDSTRHLMNRLLKPRLQLGHRVQHGQGLQHGCEDGRTDGNFVQK